jgi:arabinofuranan 3-O-arabinosyltransferase
MRHLGLILTAAALLATLTNDPHAYVADARFEHAWAGEAFLDRHRQLWDSVRTLGRPTQFFSPVVGTLTAVADVVGVPPSLTQRLLHTAYLVVAGLGAAQMLRLFRPRLAPEHLVCGLLFMFNPYTTQFLLPSGLFLHYALAPWFVVAIIRGARAPAERWRWAAVFTLAVFTLGALNTASLVYALAPIGPVAFYEVVVARELRLRDLAAISWRAALLGGAASTAAVTVLLGSRWLVTENLTITELPRTVSSRSSWTESWRGLGSWLTYFFRPGGSPLRPEAKPYLLQPIIVASTFVAPTVALVVLSRSRWKPRLCFGLLALTGAMILVGLFPPADPPPFGAALTRVMDDHLFARSFRNTYKAGAMLMLGVAPLVAAGATDAVRAACPARWRVTRNRSGTGAHGTRIRTLLIGVPLALAAVMASFPFWSGNLYSPRDRMTDLPSYWQEATRWLDEQPGGGSVLVVPGVNRARYRWGYPGDVRRLPLPPAWCAHLTLTGHRRDRRPAHRA